MFAEMMVAGDRGAVLRESRLYRGLFSTVWEGGSERRAIRGWGTAAQSS